MRVITAMFALILTLSVSPYVGAAPQKVDIKVYHPFQEGDHRLFIGIFCNGEMLTLSERPLDKGVSPYQSLSFVIREAGDCAVIASVQKTDGKEDVRTKKLEIRGF